MKAVFILCLVCLASFTLARPTVRDTLSENSQARERREDEAVSRRRGSVTGGVRREDGVGTVAEAQAKGTLWESGNGRSRLDVHGDWSKVLDGPGRGKPSYDVGLTFTF